MNVASSYSSSKVTVEYHDPAGIFPLVSAQLQARLPLRNLHWKSSSRPLRSIDSLHVELVPGEDGNARPSTAASQDSRASHDSQRSSQTNDGATNRPVPGFQPFRPLPKERRHQIPGLRKTPYLKVYLLKCDDSEAYKSVCRKEVRDWIRANASSSETKSHSAQEKHDAFDWLILHVTSPNTQAAAQPRFSGSASSSTGTAKDRSTATRWPGGKSTTIFEKIRSDFNSSNSHSLDRVAQVRLQNDDLPESAQSAAVIIPPWPETEQERANSWNDVVVKLKSLILSSFDSRVGQYEEDIREKDRQRSLPGWNFCTFFVLKEGLAQSFEGVGLVEDALVIYDELGLGLDTTIQDKAAGRTTMDATTFLDSTREMTSMLQDVVRHGVSGKSIEALFARPISERSKPYRDMIVSSNISIFDFRCYLFARQLALLARLGRSSLDLSSVLRSTHKSQDARRNSFDDMVKRRSLDLPGEENLGALAEICRRTLSFVSSTSQTLRLDLDNSLMNHGHAIPLISLHNFIASWTVAVVEQVLAETATPALESFGVSRSINSTLSSLKVSRQRTQSAIGDLRSTNSDSEPRLARSSSLANRPISAFEPGAPAEARRKSNDAASANENASRFGGLELCANRAALYLFERSVLQRLGRPVHWDVSWSALADATVSLDHNYDKLSGHDGTSQDTALPEFAKSESPLSMHKGLCIPMLVKATTSVNAFRRLFETLTLHAVSLQSASGHSRSVEVLLGDLAISKLYAGDYAEASSLLGRITSSFADTTWNQVEVAMLLVHVRCLKALNRRDDCVRTLLQLLSKAAARCKTAKGARSKIGTSRGMQKALGLSPSWLDDDIVHGSGILKELLSYSAGLPYDVSVPLATCFSELAVDPCIRHYTARDGFSLQLNFRYLLDEAFVADSVQVRLVATSSEQKRDIVLESEAPVEIRPGMVNCIVHSNVTTFASFMVERIVLKSKRICFVHEPFVKDEHTSPLRIIGPARLEAEELSKRSHLLCYPRTGSFEAKIRLARHTYIDKVRSIEVIVRSGSQAITSFELRLRPGSAGLRLQTADASVTSGNPGLRVASQLPGVLQFRSVPAHSCIKVNIPYGLESQASEIFVRLDVEYQTEDGLFQFFSQAVVPVDLPVDVNVQDSFKPGALFSTFNIRTSASIPLLLHGATLGDSSFYVVQGPMGGSWPRIVLPTRGVSLQFALERHAEHLDSPRPLLLDIHYQRLDEQIEAVAEATMGTAIAASDLANLSRLIVPAFVERLMQHIPEGDFAAIILHDEVRLPAFSDFGWQEVLDAVPVEMRQQTATWLATFHERKAKLLLRNIEGYDAFGDMVQPNDLMKPTIDIGHTHRRITIAVSIPTVHVVSTIAILVEGLERGLFATHFSWLVGQARPATLCISHTRRWTSALDLMQTAELNGADQLMQFTYEVDYNPEIWIIGGSTRGTFWQEAGEEAQVELQLHLIPLRKGEWTLPSVEVRPVQPASRSSDQRLRSRGSIADGVALGEKEPAILSECCSGSAFQRATIVADVRSTTVGLMNGGASILLDTLSKSGL